MDISELLGRIQHSLLEIDETLSRQSDIADWSIKDMSEAYATMASLKAQLGVVMQSLESSLIERMTDKEAVSLESGAVLVKDWSKSRKSWQHKDLVSAVADRIQQMAIDMDTGERTMTTGQMIEALLEYVQPSYWRVGALSSIGLNADAFCEASDPQPKIRIEKAQ